MHCYGVKTKSGKVMWVQADSVEVRDGMVLFCTGQEKRVIAGFPAASIDHFGLPEAFATQKGGGH